MSFDLIQLARDASNNAYSPYSNIKVGCALLSRKNLPYIGANIENSSYGLTNCAERTAIFNGITAEGVSFKIDTIVILSTTKPYDLNMPPCGACRQVISEFSDAETRIIFYFHGNLKRVTLKELIPNMFSINDI